MFSKLSATPVMDIMVDSSEDCTVLPGMAWFYDMTTKLQSHDGNEFCSLNSEKVELLNHEGYYWKMES